MKLTKKQAIKILEDMNNEGISCCFIDIEEQYGCEAHFYVTSQMCEDIINLQK